MSSTPYDINKKHKRTYMFLTLFCRNLARNIKYQRVLNDAYEKDQTIAKLSYALGTQVKRDWIGRLYAVVNPAIRDGKFDQSQAFEYTQEGYDTTEHAKEWVMGRLFVVENFIKAENLFDVLAYDFKKLDEHGNYLIVFYPITLPDTLKSAKRALVELGVIGAGLATYFCAFA